MTPPLGVVLAGGQARRMGGGDKALLILDGQSLLSRVTARLSPQVSGLALNANGDPARFSDYNLPIIADSVTGFPGPLAGVLAGLDWAAGQGADTIVTAAADTPFFPIDLVPRLIKASAGMAHPLVLAATPDVARGQICHPTFGLWPVALRDNLRAALGQGLRKVVMWTILHEGREALFPEDHTNLFFNVNTPDDLAQARSLLKDAS